MSSARSGKARSAELVVHDEPGPCHYLPGEIARLPLRLPRRMLTRAELDERLEAGFRRNGVLLYRPECTSCRACEPIRIEARAFELRRSHRRVLRRAESRIRLEFGPPEVTAEKVELYERHRLGRGLAAGDGSLDPDGYRAFLVDSCCDTFEMRMIVDGRLGGVAIVDRGERSLSAVYTFYDPAHEDLSPGVFSILTQLGLCRRLGLSRLYLGLYVEGCARMEYKARYLPHERRIGGEWIPFARR